MVKINFNDVKFPSCLQTRMDKEYNTRVMALVGKNLNQAGVISVITKEKATELLERPLVDKIQSCEGALMSILDNHLNYKYLDKVEKKVVAPLGVRSRIGIIRYKLFDTNKGVVEFTPDEFEFIIKACTTEGAYNDYQFYLVAYLQSAQKAFVVVEESKSDSEVVPPSDSDSVSTTAPAK